MGRESIQTFTNPDEKLGYHQNRTRELVETGRTIPISLEVDLSNICGDLCDHCHLAHTHKKGLKDKDGNYDPNKIMTIDVAETVFRKLAEGGVKSVVFSGGGEPLDSPLALEIFKIARKNGLECGMYTRGLGLKGEIAEFVAREFEWVVVSLDATNSEDHFNIKHTRTFDKKVKNILDFASKDLVEKDEPYIEGKTRRANISVSCMVNERCLDEAVPYPQHQYLFENRPIVTRLERDIAWFKDLGVDEVQIRPIVDTGSYQEQIAAANNIINLESIGLAFSNQVDRQTWEHHYSWIPFVAAILENYLDDPQVNTSLSKFWNLWDGVSGYENCDAMMISAGVIRTNGDVHKCVNMRHMSPIANLMDSETTIETIYLNPDLDRSVTGHCRAGCRGCNLNLTMQQQRNSRQQLSSTSNGDRPRHINFL